MKTTRTKRPRKSKRKIATALAFVDGQAKFLRALASEWPSKGRRILGRPVRSAGRTARGSTPGRNPRLCAAR